MLRSVARKIKYEKEQEMQELDDEITRATTMRTKLEETMSIRTAYVVAHQAEHLRQGEGPLSVLVNAHVNISRRIADVTDEFNVCDAIHYLADELINGRRNVVVITCDDIVFLDSVIQALLAKNDCINGTLGFEMVAESDLSELGPGIHAIIVKTDDPRRLEHRLMDMTATCGTPGLQFAIIVPSFHQYVSMFFDTIQL